MTENIARHIAADPVVSPEERRLARLWLCQRRLFPGDGGWWRQEAWRESQALVDRPQPLVGTIAELLSAKKRGDAA